MFAKYSKNPILQSGAENIKTALPLPSERNYFHNRTPPQQQSPNKQRSRQDSEACCWTCSQHVTHMHTLWEKPVCWIRKQTGRQLSCCWWRGYRSVCEDRALHMYFEFTFVLVWTCFFFFSILKCTMLMLLPLCRSLARLFGQPETNSKHPSACICLSVILRSDSDIYHRMLIVV